MMVKLQIGNEIIECEKVIKGNDYIHIYNDSKYPCCSYEGISDFLAYKLIEGEWSYPEPSKEEVLQGKLDYLAMMTGVDLEV